tara:strand:+ start:876 stop:1403 length:528 start_codon:yes stop_codon:yes gene_type:complete
MKPFSLYDDNKKTITGTSTKFINPDQEEESVIEVNLSDPETLYSMSSIVRSHLKDKPDDYQLTLYLVCGNVPSKDVDLFAEYLKDLTQPIVVAFRGIIHFDFIHIFIDNVVYINETSKIRYSKEKLHDTMKNFLVKPEAYKKFMQRFVDEYWRLNEGNMLPISELGVLGIKTEIL